jgi:hypothetical protein
MTTTRWGTTLALGLLLVATAAGCAKNTESPGVATAASGAPKGSPTSTAEPGQDDELLYSRCMRENGMTWFPDPEDGRLAVRVPSDVDQKKMQAAQEACRKYSPDGGDRPPPDPEAVEQARQMSKCMRANGVPNFPDPQPDGGIAIDGDKLGTGPGEPDFDKAEQVCAKHRPAPRNRNGGGGA